MHLWQIGDVTMHLLHFTCIRFCILAKLCIWRKLIEGYILYLKPLFQFSMFVFLKFCFIVYHPHKILFVFAFCHIPSRNNKNWSSNINLQEPSLIFYEALSANTRWTFIVWTYFNGFAFLDLEKVVIQVVYWKIFNFTC